MSTETTTSTRTRRRGANLVVTACARHAVHRRLVVTGGARPCRRCAAERLSDAPVSVAYVELLITEAVGTWLPAILHRADPSGMARAEIPWRAVTTVDALEMADCLARARELLGGLDAATLEGLEAETPKGHKISALRAVHETLHACHALSTLEHAVDGRAALVAEILRRTAPVYRAAVAADHDAVKHAWQTAVAWL